jgi:hypothetical protein
MLQAKGHTDHELIQLLKEESPGHDLTDLLVKEASALAAHIKARTLALSKMKEAHRGTVTREMKVLDFQLSVLTITQTVNLHMIVAAKAERDSAATLHGVLTSLEPDEDYVPEATIKLFKSFLQSARGERPGENFSVPDEKYEAIADLVAGLERAPSEWQLQQGTLGM